MRSAPWLATCVAALRGPPCAAALKAGGSSSSSGALVGALACAAPTAPHSSPRPAPSCSHSQASTSTSSGSSSCAGSATGASGSAQGRPPRLHSAWPHLARRRVPAGSFTAAAGAGRMLRASAATALSASLIGSGSSGMQWPCVASASREGPVRRCLHTSAAAAAAASAATASATAASDGGGSCRTGLGAGGGEEPGMGGRGGGRGGGGGAHAPPREEGLGAVLEVFNKPLKSLQRDRAAALQDGADPLLAAISSRLLDRLEDCRGSFRTAVVLGGAALPVVRQLCGGRGGIQRLIVVDPSQAMLDRLQREEAEARAHPDPTAKPWPSMSYVLGDEEHLPLAPKSVDLIISCLGLHWANDLPGAMAQCRAALVPDGLFLAALLGGDTLQEMRIACALAQMEREGGVSAVISPLAQVRDAGNLLTRADLRLPSVDVDAFHIGYPSPLELVQHLRALGESNASAQRRHMLPRDSALAAAAVYQSMFGFRPQPDQEGEEAQGQGQQGQGQGRNEGRDVGAGPGDEAADGSGGGITATYQVIFMTGWAPAPHQPKAAKRGSATVSFQDLADGLVKGGQAVGGTAEEGIVAGAAQEESPLPSRRKPQ